MESPRGRKISGAFSFVLPSEVATLGGHVIAKKGCSVGGTRLALAEVDARNLVREDGINRVVSRGSRVEWIP